MMRPLPCLDASRSVAASWVGGEEGGKEGGTCG